MAPNVGPMSYQRKAALTGWVRLCLDAVLWIVRTGAPWRDLPPELGRT
jgi:transposase